MKIDKKTAFSVFIVLLFVGSMFAIMTYGSRDNTSINQKIPEDLNLDPTPYKAEFDSKVMEIFPQLIIAGKPVDYDKGVIETKLLDVSGIKNKKVGFNQLEDGNISVIIHINIDINKKEQIIEDIKNLEIIQEPLEIYQSALLTTTKDINFTSDTNEIIEYTFGAAPFEGIVNYNTSKGDDLSVVCYASFRGKQLISATGIEVKNQSNAGQWLFSTGDFNIISFEPKIYLSTDINSDDNEAINVIKNNIKDYNFETIIDSEKLAIVFNEENIDVSKIDKIFENLGKDISTNKYQKVAMVDTQELIIKNKEYDYEQQTQALVDYPEDINKTIVTLNIQAYIQKDNLLYLGLSK